MLDTQGQGNGSSHKVTCSRDVVRGHETFENYYHLNLLLEKMNHDSLKQGLRNLYRGNFCVLKIQNLGASCLVSLSYVFLFPLMFVVSLKEYFKFSFPGLI